MNPRLWFYDQGISIFPIDRRDKSPIVPKGTSQFDYRCTRAQAQRMGDYGISLGSLAVADSDDVPSETWVSANLPDTPFKVTTARGRHRYYRIVGSPPHFFHRAGLTIEFRHAGQYVVGPGSIHQSGVTYTADAWSWNIRDVPMFPVETFEWDDRPLDQRGSTEGGAPLVLPPIIRAGERHDLMFKLMRSLQARGVTDIEVLLLVLRVENKEKCSPPIEDRELEKYIRRVANYRDRPGFERDDQDVVTAAGGMLEVGLSLTSALALAKTDPAFDPGLASDDTAADEPKQPKQPKQPISESAEQSTEPKSVESTEEIGSKSVESTELSCIKCGHCWLQRRAKPPRTCPQCRSTIWNRPIILPPSHIAEGEEIVELDDDEDSDIYDEETLEVVGRREKGVTTWYDNAYAQKETEAVPEEVEEDCDIYDEDGEVVGRQVNGVITWKDAK